MASSQRASPPGAPSHSFRDDPSDADSDLEELEGDIAKFDQSVRQFLASHTGNGGTAQTHAHQPGVRGAPRGRGARGPRKAAKVRGDITARLSKVNQAFLGGDYTLALGLVSEVIRINAETHQAWTTLASIFGEIGEVGKALPAMVYAAHLRPKDVAGWLRCASYALDTIDIDEAGNLQTARLCFSAALRADPTNIEARLGKATVCHQQGHFATAVAEYNQVLKRQPRNLDVVRKLAEACIDNRNADATVPSAIAAYRCYFDLEMADTSWDRMGELWHDVGIYVELFASTGRYHEAIAELKGLSRWLVGRFSEQFWDAWHDDDCEWDAGHDRRSLVPGFTSVGTDTTHYGMSLPYDLRARLAIYRMRLGDEEEALMHLSWLDPSEDTSRQFVEDFPFLAYDIACELNGCGRAALAAKYFELLRNLPGDPDTTVLLQLGRSYLACGEQAAAEECFLAAIEADESTIEPRIELANMYESMNDNEAALVLAAEAIALRSMAPQSNTLDAEGQDPMQQLSSSIASQAKTHGGTSRREGGQRRPAIPRRYRPKKLAAPDKRQQDEKAHAIKLSRQYETVRDLKQRIRDGDSSLILAWMQSSQELVDEFRYLKKFYTWDKYLHFLRSSETLRKSAPDQPENELLLMYERLSRNVAPQPSQNDFDGETSVLHTHQGISFDEWLELFLDYAIGLALEHRRDEAYQVCEAANDSTVFQSSEHKFTIHVAWSVCAIYTCDEEKAVFIARQLMRDGATTDSYRMFALLSTLCQSPIYWYTSGPSQKYILRQIKAIDSDYMNSISRSGDSTTENTTTLDICLLMLYGHILFTSTSYTYALGYFLRARALDPTNPMVNLSLGLAYVHYGLKRQSTNRQYLVLQGQAFMSQYMKSYGGASDRCLAEAYYNIGRLFHLLGLTSLALKYYSNAFELSQKAGGNRDVAVISIANHALSLLTLGNKSSSLSLLKQNVIL